jgi:hypothetical protein
MSKRWRNLVKSWNEVLRSVRSHPVVWLLLAVAVLSTFVGFFWVMNFLVADTPAEALAKWSISLPPNWEAGVMNHGKYFEWYTISAHPFAFVGAVFWLAASASVVVYLHKRSRLTARSRADAP